MEGVMDIESIIRSYRTIAVVGLSPDPARPSYGVANFLKTLGFTIAPVRPDTEEILGEKAYPSLKDIPFPVEIVNVFRRPDAVLPIAEDAIEIGAKVLWLQEGIINAEAEKLCSEAGMDVVMDKCLLKEYRRLLSRLMAGGAGCMSC
jgi:predicted CoA-binding protein